MRLRTYENLMRIILLLISIQFFSLAISPGEGVAELTKKHQNLKAEHSKSLSLSVFFEESKGEKEGEGENEDDRAKLVHCVEIGDLSFLAEILSNVVHTPILQLADVGQQFDLKPPLFKLHSIYII